MGSIGPVEYGFAPQQLIRAEIQLELPPSYQTTVWAIKFIPLERAATLGEASCRYGQSGRVQICTADRENGLAMALLERPITDYSRAFAETGVPAAQLRPSSVAGSRGFKFTAEDEGTGTTYGFYPVGDRTLLLAERFTEEGLSLDPAIGPVLQSLRLPQRD